MSSTATSAAVSAIITVRTISMTTTPTADVTAAFVTTYLSVSDIVISTSDAMEAAVTTTAVTSRYVFHAVNVYLSLRV